MSAAAFAEEVGRYLVDAIRARHPSTWSQGVRTPAIASSVSTPNVHLFATTRIVGLKNDVAEALVGWADGRRKAERLYNVPHWRDVLARQARGERCVSILDESVPTAPHADGLAFAVHDLCHLEKFNDPESHAAQVGFFRALDLALSRSEFDEFSARFDSTWLADLEHVAADMNGSPVFLMAALKMKLKMAVRRELAREGGYPAPVGGPLDENESVRFASALEELLKLLAFDGPLAEAIRQITTKRDSEQAGRVVHRVFQASGTLL